MKSIVHYWESVNPLTLLLLPISWLFCALSSLRRSAYKAGVLKVHRLPVPVIVVGNITVGGTGKTPLVIRLVEHLINSGYRPGVVSRGYGGRSESWPREVHRDSNPTLLGDEPVLIARRLGCPVWVGPDRPAAARQLVDSAVCDIIVSDDGMQHYALDRNIEVAVVDGKRRFGNGFCLPAGPLRETRRRLNQVDLVVNNGCHIPGEFEMNILVGSLINLLDSNETRPLVSLKDIEVHAVAGIGHPARFFDSLRAAGLKIIEHAFPDHHNFSEEELAYDDRLPLIMTEKDAVKCAAFAKPHHWYLPVYAELEEALTEQLDHLLKERNDG